MRWGPLSIVAATVFGGTPNVVEGQIGAGSYQVAIVGDSLTIGAGIRAERAYPNVIQQLAVNERWPIRINVYAGTATRQRTVGGESTKWWREGPTSS